MRNLILAAIILVAGYQVWSKLSKPGAPEPLHVEPYVVVYGRESCGYTQAMRSALVHAGVPFEYRDVDASGVSDTLHDRMQRSGIDVSSYYLPVVDVSGSISVRPQSKEVVQAFKAPPS